MFRRTAIAVVLLLTPLFAHAGSPVEGTAITIGDVEGLVESIADTLLYVAGLAVVIYIVYGGAKMVMSAGDTGKFKTGKDIVYKALIGGAIIFGVGVIVNTIANFARDPTTINRGEPRLEYAREGVSS